MNSIPFYRDFGVAGELTRRPRTVERDIARVARDLGLGNPGGRLTDEIERRLFQHLTGNRGFRP